MIRLTKFLFLIALLSISGCTNTIHDPKDLLSKFESKGHRMRLGAPYSGVMLISKGDSIMLHQAYGYEDWEKQTTHSVDNKFPIGSITKQFTAMLVMIQVDRGLLNLDTPIHAYLPQLQSSKLRQVTMHQLLSHTAGLPHYEGFVSLGYDYTKFATSTFAPAQLVQLIDQIPLRYTPGEGYYYSSLGYMLLGAILEQVTQMNYSSLLRKEITEPLEMNNTGYEGNEFVKENVVAGHNYRELYGLDWWTSKQGGEISPAKFRDQSGKFATGGIHSTAKDLWIWSKAIRDKKLISHRSYNRMLTPNIDGYCYGWIRNWDDLVERNTNARMISHGGALPGYRSSIAVYDDGITIISLSNIQPVRDKDLLHQVYSSVSSNSEDVELEGYPEWSSADEFEQNGGFSALTNYFERLSDLCGYEVKPSASSLLRIGIKYLDAGKPNMADSIFNATFNAYEIEANTVNNLGYFLIEEKFCEQAKLFFAYNIENDSLSANAWDSMGDAYHACGDLVKAREFFSLAVQRAKKTDDRNLELFQKKYDQALSSR